MMYRFDKFVPYDEFESMLAESERLGGEVCRSGAWGNPHSPLGSSALAAT
jgi:hypothetical protein